MSTSFLESIVFSPVEEENYIICTYWVESSTNLKEAAWAIAIGQSIGNPSIRNVNETEELLTTHVARILDDPGRMGGMKTGEVKIAYPLANWNPEMDGITQLMCMVMGGQLDIDIVSKCHLLDIKFPQVVLKNFKGPQFGLSYMRERVRNFTSPLLGGIIKPKIGLKLNELVRTAVEMADAGCEFIKEDEIFSSPAYLPLEQRVEAVGQALLNYKTLYSFCVNSDVNNILRNVQRVVDIKCGILGVHLNIHAGLGAYKYIRDQELPICIHFQKSGDRLFTNKTHAFYIDWNVICKLASLMGVDSIHAGMYGGYMSNSEEELRQTLKILKEHNVIASLSCGMKPELISPLIDKFGIDFMATSGGWIHGHVQGVGFGIGEMKNAIVAKRAWKVKIFMLTYNDEEALNSGLQSLFASDFDYNIVEVNIINNNTNFHLHDAFKSRINKVYDNTLQPDWGTGHCARNWNQALITGFKDLNNPDCDIVVCVQDDIVFGKDWLKWVIDLHKSGKEFIAAGIGDNLCSYTAQAVRSVGLWDEQMSALHYAEAEYFLRAILWLGDKASINDRAHGENYTWNYVNGADERVTRPGYTNTKRDLHHSRHTDLIYQQFHNRKLFRTKWGIDPINLKIPEFAKTLQTKTPLYRMFMLYPYFEKNIENLEEKGYFSIEPTMDK